MSDKHQVPADKEIRTRIKEGRTIATEIIQDQIGKEVIIPVGKDIKLLNLNRFIVFENHFFMVLSILQRFSLKIFPTDLKLTISIVIYLRNASFCKLAL